MAIAFDSSLNSSGASFSFNNVSGNFIVAVACTNSATALSATYNSVSMSIVGTPQQFSGQSNWIQVFTLMSPATGSNTIAFTGTNKVFNSTVVSYSGVKTSGQPEVNGQTNANGTSVTRNINTTTDNSWVVAAFGANIQPSSYTNVTARAGNIFPYVGDTNGAVTPAGTITQTATGNSTPWAMVHLAFAPTSTRRIFNIS